MIELSGITEQKISTDTSQKSEPAYMNIQAYLDRIKYTGDTTPNAETLRQLQRAHMLAVPFENLDIHINRPIELDTAKIYDKIVNNQRGGFCYEQNGLFAEILTALGYTVTRHEARVNDGEGNYNTPFDHLTLIVTLDERWLVDVGFGDAFIEPLKLDDPNPQVINGKTYRVQHDGTIGYYAERKDDTWRDEFRFDMTPRGLSEFASGCHYHQTSPDSGFTKKRVCSLAKADGRITLSELLFIETKNGVRTEHELQDEAEFTQMLKTHFGVVL